MVQRLSSFSFKNIFQYANPRGLLLGSIFVATPLILINEKIIQVLSRIGIQDNQELLRAQSIPRRKPDFVVEWEKNYKKN